MREIGWTHNLIIFERCKDELQREFYIRMTRKVGWTKNVLIHQIDNQTFEKTLLNQTNFDRTVSEDIRAHAELAVKDEYTFDFLELGDEHSARQLEHALLDRVASFLHEMGGMFTFLGSQYRLAVSDKEYFIDLLLFNRRLRALVAIELKIGEFLPEFVGKMQFYLAVLDDRRAFRMRIRPLASFSASRKTRRLSSMPSVNRTNPLALVRTASSQNCLLNSRVSFLRRSRLRPCWKALNDTGERYSTC